MKTRYILTFSALLLALASCRNEQGGNGSRELCLAASVEAPATREIGFEFFEAGAGIDVEITPSSGSGMQEFIYTYGTDNLFRGDPGYRFPMDDSYVETLTAYWPRKSVRTQEVPADQRDKDVFRHSDWMTATTGNVGVMPADAPVPLNFYRENALLEFELVGQNTLGLDIESLLIELSVDGNATAFRAYCGDPGGHAKLILPAGTKLFAPENYLIGTVTVSDQSLYTIKFPETDLAFEQGKRYLVTLTPQGYFMSVYITIGDWNQGEEGVGIPFQRPVPDIDGEFAIDNAVQLITLSYLVRHYTDGTTIDWPQRTYNVSPGIGGTMTEELAALYVPIPRDMFSGRILMNGADLNVINYGADGELFIYDDNQQ